MNISEQKYFLGAGGTPLIRMERFERQFPGYTIYIKRDDLNAPGLGGNKLRKLEYLIADAKRKGCDTLITAGAPQSNHCRQTAAAAVMSGMECHLVLGGESPKILNGNILLDKLLGASVLYTEKEKRGTAMEELAENLRSRGKRPYIIPVGGSNSVGALGYAAAAEELGSDMKKAGIGSARLILASSSGGTQAGLVFGVKHFQIPLAVEGIRIDKEPRTDRSYIDKLTGDCQQMNRYFGSDHSFTEGDFKVNYNYNSREYGDLGREERDAILRLARAEGIFLDPVYTGRAFAGLLGELEKKTWPANEPLIFLHTGGTPALFAYADRFSDL